MPAITEHPASGFGTLLAAEHELLDTVRRLLASATARRNRGAARILEQHVGQLEAIIALVGQRDQLLPHPARFDALHQCVAPLTHFATDVSTDTEQPLAELVTRNRDLQRNINALIEQSGHRDKNETGLREAAQRHDEMEWMLTALINEDALPARDPVAVEPTKAETAWENEGGGS